MNQNIRPAAGGACQPCVAHVADESVDAGLHKLSIRRLEIERANVMTHCHQTACEVVPKKTAASRDDPCRHGSSYRSGSQDRPGTTVHSCRNRWSPSTHSR